jgi:hypothetical protein
LYTNTDVNDGYTYIQSKRLLQNDVVMNIHPLMLNSNDRVVARVYSSSEGFNFYLCIVIQKNDNIFNLMIIETDDKIEYGEIVNVHQCNILGIVLI